jgi:CTP:molybdopterin cytidylyltransferase MocA
MKLLADVAGEALLNRTLRSLLDGGCLHVAVVSSAFDALAAVPLMGDSRITIVVNPDPSRGMFSSIQCGLSTLDRGRTSLILPADMPFVRSDTVGAVAGASTRTGAIVVPVHGGRRGHPLALPPALVPPLLAADPSSSLRDVLAALGQTPHSLVVDDPGVLRDVDVPADLGA